MDRDTKSKIVIVGAGPAGLSCAISLRRLGVEDILVVDSHTFPRDKCCAGYVTSKTGKVYKELGLNIEDCNYSLIEDFSILSKNVERQKIKNKFLYTNRLINRVELDHGFFLVAKDQGIDIWEDAAVVGLNVDEKIVELSGSRTVSFDKLVFADGTMGFGRKYQTKRGKMNIAMQCLFEADIPDKIDIHFGISKKGYGWVSSYKGRVNIGLTDVWSEDTNYRELFADFLNELQLDVNTDGLYAAFTPMTVGEPIVQECIYYAGDALGACDPMTLSGLRYGLASGKKVAESISSGDNSIIKKYVASLKRRFWYMRVMQSVFYLAPVQFLVFDVGCRFFGEFISAVFNNFFVNKK